MNATLKYIGQIQEILELNYGRHCIVVLVYEWVKINYRGRNAIVKKDEWGFTLANFNCLLPFGTESFAFPIHCDQVFFSNDEDEPGWKVVLQTEERGRRIDSELEEEEETEMFRMENNTNFERLRQASTIPESHPNLLLTGRNLKINELLGEGIEEANEFFDRDLGESSKDED